MTRDIDIRDTEFPGAMKVRFVDVDVTNYDSDSSGDGEPISPKDVGMHRFQKVDAEVMFGQGTAATVVNCVAQYDYDNGAIRLLQQANDGAGETGEGLVELPSDADEGAMVRLECKGR